MLNSLANKTLKSLTLTQPLTRIKIWNTIIFGYFSAMSTLTPRYARLSDRPGIQILTSRPTRRCCCCWWCGQADEQGLNKGESVKSTAGGVKATAREGEGLREEGEKQTSTFCTNNNKHLWHNGVILTTHVAQQNLSVCECAFIWVCASECVWQEYMTTHVQCWQAF